MEALIRGVSASAGTASESGRQQFRSDLSVILHFPVGVRRGEDVMRTDAVGGGCSGPVIDIFSVSWFHFDHFWPNTAVIRKNYLFLAAFRLYHLLFQQLIDSLACWLTAEMRLNSTQSLLLLSFHALFFNDDVGDFGCGGIIDYLFEGVPFEDRKIAVDPIFSIVFMYFLQAGADGLLFCTFLEVCAQHFFQFLSLKGAPYPFLFVGIEQQALSIEDIILKLSNVQISIGKVSLAVVLQPISEIEASFVALRLKRREKVIVVFVDFQLKSHSLEMVAGIDESDHYLSALFEQPYSIVWLKVHPECVLMPDVHDCMQLLAQDLFNDISVGLDYLSCDFTAVVEDVIDVHCVEIDENSLSISEIFLFVERKLDDALASPHCQFHQALFKEKHRNYAIFPEDDVVAGHGIKAIL